MVFLFLPFFSFGILLISSDESDFVIRSKIFLTFLGFNFDVPLEFFLSYGLQSSFAIDFVVRIFSGFEID